MQGLSAAVFRRTDLVADAEPALSISWSHRSPCHRGLPCHVSFLSQITGSGDTICYPFPNLSFCFSSEPATLQHLCVAKSSVILLVKGPAPQRLGLPLNLLFLSLPPRMLSAAPLGSLSEVCQCSEHQSPPKMSPS